MTWNEVITHYENLNQQNDKEMEQMISLIHSIEKDSTVSRFIPNTNGKELLISKSNTEYEVSPHIKVIPFPNDRVAIGIYNTQANDMRSNNLFQFAVPAIIEALKQI